MLVDHPQQLQALSIFQSIAGFPAEIFIKIDTGYHRAGVNAGSPVIDDVLDVIKRVSEPSGFGVLKGFYSHAGHSYGGTSEEAAMDLLTQELEGSMAAAAKVVAGASEGRRLVLSVGATPTATALESLIDRTVTSREGSSPGEFLRLKDTIARAERAHAIELHAGVYTLLDLQQLATHAREECCMKDVALTILAEVVSVYPDRDPQEALIAAGSLALGREPCKSYNGWGLASQLNAEASTGPAASGWVVNRVSQEHGILRKETFGESVPPRDLQIGDMVRIWPNHACIAGAGFDWYYVVDSRLSEGENDVIVDIWVRWRGW